MSSVVHSAASSKWAARSLGTADQFFAAKKTSSDPVAIRTESLELKQAEHFEDDDDNDNDSDDVEDISAHGSWIPHRYLGWQAIRLRNEKLESEALARRPNDFTGA